MSASGGEWRGAEHSIACKAMRGDTDSSKIVAFRPGGFRAGPPPYRHLTATLPPLASDVPACCLFIPDERRAQLAAGSLPVRSTSSPRRPPSNSLHRDRDRSNHPALPRIIDHRQGSISLSRLKRAALGGHVESCLFRSSSALSSVFMANYLFGIEPIDTIIMSVLYTRWSAGLLVCWSAGLVNLDNICFHIDLAFVFTRVRMGTYKKTVTVRLKYREKL